jgi:hypothetical protein
MSKRTSKPSDIAQSQWAYWVAVGRDQGMVNVFGGGHPIFQHTHGFERGNQV